MSFPENTEKNIELTALKNNAAFRTPPRSASRLIEYKKADAKNVSLLKIEILINFRLSVNPLLLFIFQDFPASGFIILNNQNTATITLSLQHRVECHL